MNMQRAQFEQWAQRNGYLIEKLQDNHATYEFSSTLNAYHGWQAATEQSQKEIAELEAQRNHWQNMAGKFTNDEFIALENLTQASLEIEALQAREKVLVDLAKLTYGYLWHINAGLDAPAILNVTSITPEKCSRIVRKLWLDVLTKEQRGEGINKALEALANVRGE